jgi:hypothetical protein
MTLREAEIFEIARVNLNQSYPDANKIAMPYCSLYQDVSTRKKYYRVQLNYKRGTDKYDRSAIFQIDPESGEVEFFKDNYNWTYWS